MAQIAADAFGVPIASIDQIHGDTDLTEDAGKSSASRQTFVSGNAARFAALDLRRRDPCALANAGRRCALRARWRGRGGRRSRRRDPCRPVGTARLTTEGDVALEARQFNPPTVPLDADGQGVPYATYGFAAQMAGGRGRHRSRHREGVAIHAAHDVGRAINPVQVEARSTAASAQGLGPRADGRIRPRAKREPARLPDPDHWRHSAHHRHLIEDPEPLGPWGAKGRGEPR